MKRRKVLHLLVRHCGDHKKETCKKKNNEKLKKQNKNKQETKRPPPQKRIKTFNTIVRLQRIKEGDISENVDFSFAKMNVLLGAEIARDGHAVEVTERLDDARILNGPHVEE